MLVTCALFHTFISAHSPIVVKQNGKVKELCSDAYADSQIALAEKVREYENKAGYVRLLQTEVQYETPFYGPDGRIQQKRSKGTFYGTAFAYQRRGDEVFFLTNAHVVSSPLVTSAEHRVDGVPTGSRKVQEETFVVTRDGDDVTKVLKLTRLAVDPQADAAVLKGRVPVKPQKAGDLTIEVSPYKIGRSADLRVGNFVYVRGYPLGAFQAVNVGRVTNPFDDDHEGVWNHSDFIVDALLSQGHSGSPVFAISCKSGALELVGMYHAGYKAGSALNAVVAIDDVREFMETLKPLKRAPTGLEAELTKKDRYALVTELPLFDPLPVYPFGGGVALVEPDGPGLRFTVLDREFPQVIDRRLWIVDKADDAFGDVIEVGFREDSGQEVVINAADFDARLKERVTMLYVALARQALWTKELRQGRALKAQKLPDLVKLRTPQKDALESTLDELEAVVARLRAEAPDKVAVQPR